MLRFEHILLFIGKTIMFGVVVYRNEFSRKNIESKSLSLVKKIAPNNVPDIGAGKGVKNCMNDKNVIQLVTSLNDTTFEIQE